MSSHCGSSSFGFFYKPVWPLKHNCFRYMYHVNDGCVEGSPNILFSVKMHQLAGDLESDSFIQCQYLMTIIKITVLK